MSIDLKCPSCGYSRPVPDELLGKKVKCPSCEASFRVGGPQPSASADPAPAVVRARAEARDPRPSTHPAQSQAVSAPGREPKPSALAREPFPSANFERGGLPPWVFAAIGGAAVGVLCAVVGAILFLGGSPSGRFPDPAVDVALGVASGTRPQSEQLAGARPAAAPAVVAGNVPLSTSSARAANKPALTAPAVGALEPSTSPAQPASTAPLTAAQIVKRWEPSVALVKGEASSGTGFLVKPGIVVTNAHVFDGEFISNLEIRFPSAPAGKQGPLPAELLYEDSKRDLAFLAVESDLPEIDVAQSYAFAKGEEVTVIGNPGLGDEVVLENAISRGVMSSKTVIEGMNFLQLGMSINPGNSGGPVFDSAGRVIGVATLKSTSAEALAFCIPVEDLQAALNQVGPARPELVSRHRALVAFKLLTVAGALYGIGLDVRAGILRKAAPGGGKPNLLPEEGIQKLDETLTTLDQKLFSLVGEQIPPIMADTALAEMTRNRYQDLSASYNTMKDLYTNTNRPADQYTSQVQVLRTKYVRLVESLQKDLKIEVPPKLLVLLKARSGDAQSRTLVGEVAAPVQSRLRSRLSQRGATGSRSSGAKTAAQNAKDRMQNLRDRARSRRGNN